MQSWDMPDGTKTSVKPRDGQTFAHHHSNQTDHYIWDGLMEMWCTNGTSFKMNFSGFDFSFAPITIDLEAMIKCECGNKENPVGQAHSHWCDRYRKEM